jgi:hypothetical protein
MMDEAGVNYGVREYLAGHKRGLDDIYVLPKPNKRLQEWSKAINLLTIDKTLALEKQIQALEGEQAQKLVQQEMTIRELMEKVDRLTKKNDDRQRRRMGFYDDPPNPVAKGKKDRHN